MSLRRIVSLLALMLMLVAVLTAVQSVRSSPASAAEPFAQCNAVDNTPGLLIACDVTVTNTVDVATGVGSAVIEMTECHGPANISNPTCVTSTRTLNDVVGSVSQCNYAVNGGGANVICNVRVVNNITGSGTAGPATVDQCNGSGAEGTEPTTLCDPAGQSTTNAAVTQCNGSANGGGAQFRVTCLVTGSTTSPDLPVSINQCNNSANGGGDTVDCTALITNNFLPVAVVTPPDETPVGTPGNQTPGTTPGGPSTTVPAPGTVDSGSDQPNPTDGPPELATTGADGALTGAVGAALLLLLGVSLTAGAAVHRARMGT